MFPLGPLVAALLAAVLAGCGHVPLLSLPSLGRIDFTTTQIADFHAAIRLPTEVRIAPDGVEMTVAVSIEGAPARSESFRLRPIDDPAIAGMLESEARPGSPIHVFGFGPREHLRMEEIRAELLAARSAGAKGSLSIGVAPRDVCRHARIPEGPVLFDTWLKTSETGTFVIVARDVDLRTQVKRGTDVAALIPPCE